MQQPRLDPCSRGFIPTYITVMLQTKAGIPKDVIEAMTTLSSTLSKGRKKRIVSPNVTTSEAIQNFTMLESHPLHKTTQVLLLSALPCPQACSWCKCPSSHIHSAI